MVFDPLFAIRPQAYSAATWIYRHFLLGGHPRPGLRILMYHAIGTPIDGDVHCLYNMTFALFREQMYCLARQYADRLVSLGIPGSTEDSMRIALTFDDGYRDNWTVAAPLLVECGIPFTVFVTTGAVAGRKVGFLSPEELRKLAELPGATIGSHTVNHPRLTDCDEPGLKEELTSSKAFLEDLLGKEIDSISYPHGAVNRRVRDMAENAGYRIGATSRFDVNKCGRDPLLLCRTDIWANDDISVFERKLCGDWDWVRWRNLDPMIRRR